MVKTKQIQKYYIHPLLLLQGMVSFLCSWLRCCSGINTIYAVDSAGNVSEPSRLISLQYPVNNSSFPVNNEVVVSYDFTYRTINIKSSIELNHIDLYDILGKKVRSRLCAGKVFNFNTNDLFSGVYLVRVSDRVGNVQFVKIFIA